MLSKSTLYRKYPRLPIGKPTRSAAAAGEKVRRKTEMKGVRLDAQFKVLMGSSKDATTKSGKPRKEYHGK
jgi:hypothetical protein